MVFDGAMATEIAARRTGGSPPLSLAELADLTAEVAQEVRKGRHEVHADVNERWHVRLRCDETVDVWLISWTTNQATQLHDHGGSSGAFTVVEGELTETVWAPGAAELVDHRRNAGDAVLFGEHYVHDVRNTRRETAVSVHAYSPPLSLMNYYDVDGNELTKLASIWTDDPEEPFDATEVRDRLSPPASVPAQVTEAEPEFSSVAALLEHARSRIERVTPSEGRQYAAAGAQLVDIRPTWQRAHDGEIPGAWIVERNHLEWRLHPQSDAALDIARDQPVWIVVCTEGYTSSLAAASLQSLGIQARDILGGITAWRDAGLPVVPGPSPVETQVAS